MSPTSKRGGRALQCATLWLTLLLGAHNVSNLPETSQLELLLDVADQKFMACCPSSGQSPSGGRSEDNCKNRMKRSDTKTESQCSLSLTCDLGFDLPLHLQRVYKDAAVADEAGTGDSPVGLAEALLVKIIPGQSKESCLLIIVLYCSNFIDSF